MDYGYLLLTAFGVGGELAYLHCLIKERKHQKLMKEFDEVCEENKRAMSGLLKTLETKEAQEILKQKLKIHTKS